MKFKEIEIFLRQAGRAHLAAVDAVRSAETNLIRAKEALVAAKQAEEMLSDAAKIAYEKEHPTSVGP